MDKLSLYRQAIKQLILAYAQYIPAEGEIENQVWFDDNHDQYQLMHVGWQRRIRVHGCVMHFDLRNSKVWIQYNGTEGDLGEELMELGVAHEDIVLGYRHAADRDYTGYALG